MDAIPDFTTAPTKKCSKCGGVFPATREYFHPKADCKYGVVSTCKVCKNAYYKQWRNANLEQRRAYYRANNIKNATTRRKSRREWYWRNRQHQLDAAKRYREKHLDKVRNSYRRWSQTERGKKCVLVNRNKRRALLRGSKEHHTADDIERKLRNQKGRCWWCGKAVGDNYHVDHIIPLSKGGDNSARNICIACPQCNNSKYNKLPSEWSDRLL